MKNNNKRPLISCIAFVCKNTESVHGIMKYLEFRYGFCPMWHGDREWRMQSPSEQIIWIYEYSMFKTLRARKYFMIFIEEDIFDEAYEMACCDLWAIDSVISRSTPISFRI